MEQKTNNPSRPSLNLETNSPRRVFRSSNNIQKVTRRADKC